jgi:septal ring factor EnvC (AmiA/AmiB activator)
LAVLRRILAIIVILVATIAFLVNAAGLVGIWVIRRPVQDTVTVFSRSVDEKLGIVDRALARFTAGADEGRQALARINDAAKKLSDRLEENRPLLTTLTAARDDLGPRMTELRARAVALHDAALRVNAVLETLDNLGLVTVPTFSNELGAVAERLDAIEGDVQELRARIDEAQTTASANLIAAVTQRTHKINSVIGQIQSTAAKYQTTVAQKREQVADRARKVVHAINFLILSFTALFVAVAAGQVLLISAVARNFRRRSDH